VALDREKYLESVKYWSNNALVKWLSMYSLENLIKHTSL
jgi:hypothetical protein